MINKIKFFEVMKSITPQIRRICAIAFAVVIGFTMIGCDNGTTPDNPGTTPDSTPTVISVTVSPSSATVAKGATKSFNATVTGTNNPEQTVKWSIDQTNKNAGTTINATSGVLTVAAAETLSTLTVRATSTVDTNKSGTATVTISGGDPRPTSPEAMSNKTALQYFSDEGITLGINVGNSLDAVDFWTNSSKPVSVETAWGNQKANQAYITGLKTLGFKIVRIPVTWTGHIGPAPDYKIDDAWIERVAEVVGYAKTAGFKAFINIHHDGHHNYGGWLDINMAMANTVNRAQIAAQYEAVWKQIAEYFKNYGDWLMFEGFNEIHDGSWDEGNGADTVAKYAIINDWNQRFTNTVRGTGGNNAQRYLIYHGYNTSYTIADTGTQFSLPTDTGNSGRQIVAFHFYFPWSFAGDANDPNWSTETSDKSRINTVFSDMKTKFINNNIPVIIGENGPARYVKHQNNPGYSGTNVATALQKRLEYIDYFFGKARENGLVPCYWENGSYPGDTAEEGDFSLINRSNGQPNSTESRTVIERMVTAINNTTPISPGADPTPPTITGNLGNYRFGTAENGVSPNYTQAVWELSGTNLTIAKTAGAKLVLVLSTAPTATMQFVWQGPVNNLWWNQKDILNDDGSVIGATGATWNSGTKTLTIPLSASSVEDYSVFTAQPSLNIIIAYYGGENVNDLGIVSANIILN